MEQNPKVIIITAMSASGIIGSGEGLPWSVESEYQQYLEFIKGNTVIIGRRSFEIFGKDLTSKITLVVSRSLRSSENAQVHKSFDDALQYAMTLKEDVYVAGGATIYRQALEKADAMYISYMIGNYSGDIYFPKIDWDRWKEIKREAHPQFEFVAYGKASG